MDWHLKPFIPFAFKLTKYDLLLLRTGGLECVMTYVHCIAHCICVNKINGIH